MQINQVATKVSTKPQMQSIIEELRNHPINSLIKLVRQYKKAPDVYEDALSGRIKYAADFTEEPATIFNNLTEIKEQLINPDSFSAKVIELFSAANNNHPKEILLKKLSKNVEIRGYNQNGYCVLKRDPQIKHHNNSLFMALKYTNSNEIKLIRD